MVHKIVHFTVDCVWQCLSCKAKVLVWTIGKFLKCVQHITGQSCDAWKGRKEEREKFKRLDPLPQTLQPNLWNKTKKKGLYKHFSSNMWAGESRSGHLWVWGVIWNLHITGRLPGRRELKSLKGKETWARGYSASFNGLAVLRQKQCLHFTNVWITYEHPFWDFHHIILGYVNKRAECSGATWISAVVHISFVLRITPGRGPQRMDYLVSHCCSFLNVCKGVAVLLGTGHFTSSGTCLIYKLPDQQSSFSVWAE